MSKLDLAPQDRIVVALDVKTPAEAVRIATLLRDHVGGFKIGLELITSTFATLASLDTGQRVRMEYLSDLGDLLGVVAGRLFYDGKWDDIPNTVKGAAEGVGPLRPKWINLHASAGIEAIKAAVAAKGDSHVLGVTVLTSISDEEVNGEFETVKIFGRRARETVLDFAEFLVEGKADGIVCSPLELPVLKVGGYLDVLESMVPAIRFGDSSKDDQHRIGTPGGAVAAGADWVVMGRDVAKAADPVAAAHRAASEIETALRSA
jgi:orotidine-5'-phosphate decarboxylase